MPEGARWVIKYTLPDFTVRLGLNLFFIRLLEKRPEWFQEDVSIDSVYGCFPSCCMNGGRTYIRERSSPLEMEETLSALQEHGVTPRFTFTNMLAGEDQLSDGYFNAMLKAGARHGAEAIVHSDKVGDYIRERFDMKLVLSTTRALEDSWELNCMTGRYDLVVLDYRRHKDSSFLKAIQEPGKVEVMVNEFCQRTCPCRQEHYLHNSADQMMGVMRPFECAAKSNAFFDHQPGHPVMFTDEEVRDMNEKFGIECYKIVGRGVSFSTVLEAYSYYLVKPSYRTEVNRLAMRGL